MILGFSRRPSAATASMKLAAFYMRKVSKFFRLTYLLTISLLTCHPELLTYFTYLLASKVDPYTIANHLTAMCPDGSWVLPRKSHQCEPSF
jgi:hypothetical protein